MVPGRRSSIGLAHAAPKTSGGHLHPGRRVHPIGGLDQAGEHHVVQRLGETELGEPLAHALNAPRCPGERTRRLAPGLREVSADRLGLRQDRQDLRSGAALAACVRCDVVACDGGGVGVEVVGVDAVAARLAPALLGWSENRSALGCRRSRAWSLPSAPGSGGAEPRYDQGV